MSGSRHPSVLLIALALLFAAGASVPLACCAGLAVGAHVPAASASHCGAGAEGASGESCCERAADDAAARHCCAGGDAFERPAPGAQPALAALPAAAAPVAPAIGTGAEVWGSERGPVPRPEPLYTLHSSLLI